MKTSLKQLQLFLIYIFILLTCSPRILIGQVHSELEGLWEGQLPMGPDYRLVVYINYSDSEKENFVQMYEKGVRQSNDNIKEINLKEGVYSFHISTVNAIYEFTKDADSLKGTITFPNGKKANVKFIKVEKPSVGDFSEIISEEKVDLLTYKYPSNQLLEDFDFLVKSIKDNQPNLYSFTSEKEFNDEVKKKRAMLKNQYTQMEFLRILTELTEKVGCGHLGVGPSAEISGYIGKVRFLPFFIKIIKGKVYIAENYIEALKDNPGVELLSINGKWINDILNQIINGLPVDGRNYSSKVAVIEQNFPSLYINHIEAADHYKIEYRIPQTNKVNVIELEGLQFGKFPKAYFTNHPEKIPNTLPIKMQIINDKVAIMRIYQFFFRDFQVFYNAVDSLFNEIRDKRITNLIIDLRGNSGGDPRLGYYVLTKIAKNDFTYFKSPDTLKNIYPLLFSKTTVNPGHFNGNVFILMDGACKSTTGHFLSLVKYNGWGKLIGRETGATFYCNGGTKNLVLPKTKIILVQPTREVVANVNRWNKLAPLKPDYQVQYRYKDIINNNDPDISFALNLIK